MKLKIFKPTLLLMALLAIGRPGFAQDTLNFDSKSFSMKDLDLNMKSLNLAMNDLNKSLKLSLKDLDKGLSVIVPEISENFKELGKNLSINLDDVVVEKMVESGDIEEKVKTYSKSYPADANDKLEINNKYGRVIVNTWNKNEFKVDIQIKADARDEETAQKLIDAISISDSKNGDLVSFRTNFGGNNGNGSIWNLFNTRNNNHKVEVNYTIYMPSKNALSVDNSYGATELPDLEGKVSINVSYGSLSAKALTHPANNIRVSYGSADIESLSSSQLDVDYGSLELGSVDKLTSDISYSSVKIGRIKSSGNINAHYAGGIQIDELDRNFTNLSINSSYSGIKVGLNNAASADFDVTVRYGGFDYSDLPVDITKKTPPDSEKGFHPTQNYKGHIGKGNTDKIISIRSSYGGVKFE
ncbi:MAG: hypothetical protein JWP37_1134 [Mucilaginibacter sp.]|nr:hypothetical protein [Mucilaginibacter sp.]